LAVELFAGAVYSQVYSGGTVFLGLEGSDHPNLLAGPLRWPDVSVAEYTTPGPIARYLQSHPGRYLTWAPEAVYYEKGYLFNQEEGDWPALADGRGTLFGIEDALGYNPLQLPRYWSYVRATDDLSIFYNASVLQTPTLQNAQLLGVRYLVVPQGLSPPIAGRVVARQYGYDLYEVSGWQPQASLVPAWSAAPDAAGALRQVLEPGFDPSSFAVVEQDPSIPTGVPASPDGNAPGTAEVHPVGNQEIQIAVDAHEPALLVVRVPYDSGWHATVNGADAPILRADYFLQAVSVPAGSSQVTLAYDDPRIGEGLLASGIVWVGLFGALGAAVLVERRRLQRNGVTSRATRAAAPPDGSGAPEPSDPPPDS
ncbi:MAG: YfhO family protein, partial [Actinomycetota bacterium]|nr:YfhO family protein [Actinomycetota bacterium]